MKKVLSLITSVALAGGFLFAPADNQKEQPKQVAKNAPIIMYQNEGPGGGMG
ncbi:hypothetical protein [Bacillus mycoides]|jgi:hypothetical protein|uniref:hypothetical protein n=1 Tax=Bacillus mycoides TaxID=1405 RepID=UPI001484FFBE|nr:hypothetical protein [Bacillus mycoides]